MGKEFNYGMAELGKLDADAERFAVKVRSDKEGARGDAHCETTRWVGLSPDQYAQVRDLIISFRL